MKEITKIYGLKALKPKNKSHLNFYECCDLTKKVYLTIAYTCMYLFVSRYIFGTTVESTLLFVAFGNLRGSKKWQVLHTKQIGTWLVGPIGIGLPNKFFKDILQNFRANRIKKCSPDVFLCPFEPNFFFMIMISRNYKNKIGIGKKLFNSGLIISRTGYWNLFLNCTGNSKIELKN